MVLGKQQGGASWVFVAALPLSAGVEGEFGEGGCDVGVFVGGLEPGVGVGWWALAAGCWAFCYVVMRWLWCCDGLRECGVGVV